MLSALERVRQLDISMICTGHGPVLDANIDKMFNTYEEWCTVINPNPRKTVVMPYVSAYGYTGVLAEEIAKGIRESGKMFNTYEEWCTVINPNPRKTVVMPYVSAYGYTGVLAEEIAKGIRESGDIDVRLYDMVTADQGKVLEELGFADGILFGTPTIVGEALKPIWDLTTSIFAGTHGGKLASAFGSYGWSGEGVPHIITPTIVGEALKPIWDLTTSIFAGTHGGKLASAFGSYGWSGEGVPHIIERLEQLRMRVTEGFTVRFKPGEIDLLNAYDYGYNFGCLLQDKENPKKKSAKTTLVKCLVCGEVFDSSMEVCPVCGVGKENFVPVEAEETEYRNDTAGLYAIIGNGAAGLNAAKAIRERDKTGSIYMISNEEYPAYNRPMLTKSLVAGLDANQIAVQEESWYESNEEYPAYNRPMLTKSLVAGLDANQIAVQEESWYEENNICQILGKNVTSIDTQKKEIYTSDGAKFKYTKLIYALGSECFVPPIPGAEQPEVIAIRRLSDTQKVTSLLPETKEAVVIGGGALGSECFVPPIPGAEQPEVIAIRRLSDTQKVTSLLPETKEAVVIGGGVLGLEAAWELKKAHCKVTVLELAPRLMGRQLDEAAGEMLKSISEAQGITIHTGVQIAAIEGEGHVTGVRLGDGQVIPAQMVIVSCGVRANTAIAQAAGLETDRAVVVNSRMETSAEDVFACGDCAQYQGVNYAIWPQAVEEGKVAGANAAGEALEYTTVPAALTFHGMNTALFSIGDNGTNPNLVYRTVEFKDTARKQYEKYYFRNNRLCGVILIGDVSRMGELTDAVGRRASFQELFGK